MNENVEGACMDDITINRHTTLVLIALAFFVLWVISALLDAFRPDETPAAVEAVEIAQ
jgi:hypothetical protein